MSWAFTLRCLLILGAFAATSYGLNACAEIAGFQTYYRGIQYAKPLPPVTYWAIEYRLVLILAILAVPGAALATFFIRDQSSACLALIGLILLAVTVGLLVTATLLPSFTGISGP